MFFAHDNVKNTVNTGDIRNSPRFVEPDGSLHSLQEHATGRYPEQDGGSSAECTFVLLLFAQNYIATDKKGSLPDAVQQRRIIILYSAHCALFFSSIYSHRLLQIFNIAAQKYVLRNTQDVSGIYEGNIQRDYTNTILISSGMLILKILIGCI
jgi:hypothetical protein